MKHLRVVSLLLALCVLTGILTACTSSQSERISPDLTAVSSVPSVHPHTETTVPPAAAPTLPEAESTTVAFPTTPPTIPTPQTPEATEPALQTTDTTDPAPSAADAAETNIPDRTIPAEPDTEPAPSTDPEPGTEAQVRYIANTNTGKFHYPTCSSVEDMKEENKWYFTGARDELIAQGYVPCKRCNP